MSNPTRPSNKGMGYASLVLLPFAAAGVAMAVLTAWCVVDWSRMQHWVETPARLVALELEGTKTYRIDAEYEYTFAGHEYTSNRVALHFGGDNVGRYQQRRFKELERAKRGGKDIVAYVNPERPSEAVLFRDLRPEMVAFKGVFAVVFGLLGVGGLVGMQFCSRDLKREMARADAHPSEPWLWRDDWAEGVIRSRNINGLVGSLLVMGLWNLLAWGAVAAMFSGGERPSTFAILAVSLFVLAGIGLAMVALVMFYRWQRFPVATLRLASTPGVVGEQLAGVILLPGVVRADDGFRLRLRCVRRVTTHKQSSDQVLWEDSQVVLDTLDEQNEEQTAVPFQFWIPAGAEPSDPYSDRHISWKLGVSAKLMGPDANFEFEVPVFCKEGTPVEHAVLEESLV
ncbi:DUF3592 domain-containing protein [Aeoliella sp. SH292]|uniref:DUF3592 domain-containing protein n=1 Tax=Aeoliella sp. SH292 TaxID=3454464 RepID=UPI003F9CF270